VGIDLEGFIKAVGLLGVFAFVFAESGLLIGIILPGDSLLFTAGFMASQDYLSFPLLVIVCVVGAIGGDAVGYWTGRKVGRRLFDRPDSRFFKQEHLRKAEEFYDKHGGKAIVLARFIPGIRTLCPILAGTTAMNYRKFTTYNVCGGLLWAVGLTTGGYVLGSSIPDPDKYLLPVIALIVLISLAPAALHLLMARRAGEAVEVERELP
jgi:membrane-associated protein